MPCAIFLVEGHLVNAEHIRNPCHGTYLEQNLAISRITRSARCPDIKVVGIRRLTYDVCQIIGRVLWLVHAGKCAERPAIAAYWHIILEGIESLCQSIPCRYAAHREAAYGTV